METKLWRIMHLSTTRDWDECGEWDVMNAEECAIVECTEEQVKEMCAKAIPIKNKDGYVANKFVYFEVKPSNTFDPIKWSISHHQNCILPHIGTEVLEEVYKQLSNGTINSYKSDDSYCELHSDPDWNYEEWLDGRHVFGVDVITSFDYIRGVEK